MGLVATIWSSHPLEYALLGFGLLATVVAAVVVVRAARRALDEATLSAG